MNPAAAKPKTIIFDFGGVMVNDRSSDPVLKGAVKNASPESQAKFKEILLKSELGKVPYSKLLEADKLLFPQKNQEEMRRFFMDTEVYEPFYIAERLLPRYPVIIFSNNHIGVPEEIAKYLNINIAQFPFINSALVGMRKPDKEFYDYLIKEHRLVATECVFIDNMLPNLVPAGELGMKTFHYQRNDQELIKFLNTEGVHV